MQLIYMDDASKYRSKALADLQSLVNAVGTPVFDFENSGRLSAYRRNSLPVMQPAITLPSRFTRIEVPSEPSLSLNGCCKLT